jgi:hypothetical protein
MQLGIMHLPEPHMLVHHNQVEGPEMRELLQYYNKAKLNSMLQKLQFPAGYSIVCVCNEN